MRFPPFGGPERRTPAEAAPARQTHRTPGQATRHAPRAVDATAPSDLFARFGLDLSEEAATPSPRTWAGKGAAVLKHRVAVKVLPNGLTERLDHRVIRVLDDRGVRTAAVQALSYDPAESIVEVRRARVQRADGTVEEIGEVGVVALASAGTPRIEAED